MGMGGLTTLQRCSQRILQTPRELGREGNFKCHVCELSNLDKRFDRYVNI